MGNHPKIYEMYRPTNRPLRVRRVGVYARVSTVNGGQPNSIDSQVGQLVEYVKNNHLLRLGGIYMDIGSGRKAVSRKELKRLLDDCKNNGIEMIVTKSVSRFGRNTADTLIEKMLINEKYYGSVIFYKTYTATFPSDKRIKNNGQREKYQIDDHHPAILSKELFDAVQESIESRKHKKTNE